MSLIQRTLTPGGLKARRQNSLASSGPRTLAGKRRSARNGRLSGNPGLPARALRPAADDLPVLGRLVKELSEAYQPADSAERLLVEDLARLRFRQRRNQRAQEGLIRKNLSRLECRRDECRQLAVLESPEAPFLAAQTVGLMHMEDSPAKYKEVGRLLRIMLDDVESGTYSEAGRQVLASIYGPMPTIRGARALGNYIQLLKAGFRPSTPGGGEDGDRIGAGSAAPTDGDDLRLRVCHADLLRALAEEKALLGGKYERYLAENIPSDSALRDAAMVPEEKVWAGLTRQELLIEQQIEAKTRLLLFTQWVRRSRSNRRGTSYIEEKTKLVRDAESTR